MVPGMRTETMPKPAFEIRRPGEDQWQRILQILETTNFHNIGGEEMWALLCTRRARTSFAGRASRPLIPTSTRFHGRRVASTMISCPNFRGLSG